MIDGQVNHAFLALSVGVGVSLTADDYLIPGRPGAWWHSAALVALLLIWTAPRPNRLATTAPVAAPAPPAADLDEAEFHTQIAPFLQQYCYACHGSSAGRESGGVALDSYKTAAAVTQGCGDVGNRAALYPDP